MNAIEIIPLESLKIDLYHIPIVGKMPPVNFNVDVIPDSIKKTKNKIEFIAASGDFTGCKVTINTKDNSYAKDNKNSEQETPS